MKRLAFCLFTMAFLLSGAVYAQTPNYQLSTHILDITRGVPANDVKITLSKLVANGWTKVDEKYTDDNGRIKSFLKLVGNTPNDGVYRLTFHTQAYFTRQNIESFYPFIEVVFEIKGGSHYHVPITLTPFGYSTYRGN